MMGIDTIVATLAVALFVEEAWSIVMVLACFAFGARTFKVIFAEQRYVGNRFAPWWCIAFAAACTTFASS